MLHWRLILSHQVAFFQRAGKGKAPFSGRETEESLTKLAMFRMSCSSDDRSFKEAGEPRYQSPSLFIALGIQLPSHDANHSVAGGDILIFGPAYLIVCHWVQRNSYHLPKTEASLLRLLSVINIEKNAPVSGKPTHFINFAGKC